MDCIDGVVVCDKFLSLLIERLSCVCGVKWCSRKRETQYFTKINTLSSSRPANTHALGNKSPHLAEGDASGFDVKATLLSNLPLSNLKADCQTVKLLSKGEINDSVDLHHTLCRVAGSLSPVPPTQSHIAVSLGSHRMMLAR